MGTIQPKGEKIRQAVRWISESMQEKAPRPISKLIEDASQRFNLSPKEEAFLSDFYEQGAGNQE